MISWRLFRNWHDDDIGLSPLLTKIGVKKIKKNAYEITGISPFAFDTRIEAKEKQLSTNFLRRG